MLVLLIIGIIFVYLFVGGLLGIVLSKGKLDDIEIIVFSVFWPMFILLFPTWLASITYHAFKGKR